MTKELTFSIIKPNAIKNNVAGGIIRLLEKGGLSIVASRMLHMTKDQAESFYDVHQGKHFFDSLVEFMTSGPVIVQVLEGVNAIEINREVMGATNPADAAPGTIRALFGESLQNNSVHGSDSPETAEREVSFFFKPEEIFPRS